MTSTRRYTKLVFNLRRTNMPKLAFFYYPFDQYESKSLDPYISINLAVSGIHAATENPSKFNCYEDVFVLRRRTGQYIVTKRRNRAGNTTRESLSISLHNTRSWPVSASNQATCQQQSK